MNREKLLSLVAALNGLEEQIAENQKRRDQLKGDNEVISQEIREHLNVINNQLTS